METKAETTIRHYEPSDYPMIQGWWAVHSAEPLHPGIIPGSSCVVEMDGEPAAFGSVFPCNNNPVAFFHGMVTRPGLTMRQARKALMALQEGIDIICRNGGHTLLLGTVPAGAMMRGARMMGFDPMGDVVHPVGRVVKPPSSENNGS